MIKEFYEDLFIQTVDMIFNVIFTLVILVCADVGIYSVIWWHHFLFQTVVPPLWVAIMMFLGSASYGIVFNLVPNWDTIVTWKAGRLRLKRGCV